MQLRDAVSLLRFSIIIIIIIILIYSFQSFSDQR